jgi:hypothetical protein
MPITMECQCGKHLRAREDLAGRRVKCPECGTVLQVPEAEKAEEELSGFRLTDEGPKADERATWPCPNCHAPLPTRARLCIQCGFDIEKGVLRHPAHVGEPEQRDPTRIQVIGQALWDLRRALVLVVLGLAVIGLIWYGFHGLSKPDSGPYDVTFTEAGTQLNMSLFWHSYCLPSEPIDDRKETLYWVRNWYVSLPSGDRLKPTWSPTKFKNAVNVQFAVPKSTKIMLFKEAEYSQHKTEIETPAAPLKTKIMMEWFDKS